MMSLPNHYAVLHLKDGDVFYYAPIGEGSYADLLRDYFNKAGFWLEVYQSFEEMVKNQNKNQFVMLMESIEKIELVGVRVYPNGDQFNVVLL